MDKDDKLKNHRKGHRARMRKRMDKDLNMDTFAEHEMLEVLLMNFVPRKDTKIIGHDLMDKFGSLDAVLNASPVELMKVKEMTDVAAHAIATILPIARRAFTERATEAKRVISSPQWCIEHFHAQFTGRKTECFGLLLLDVNFCEIATRFIEGSMPTAINVEINDVVALAVRNSAVYVAIAHNHPSGDVAPTASDLDFTWKLIRTLSGMNVHLVDHVIFGEDKVFSFRRNNIMEKYAEKLGVENVKLADSPAAYKQFITELHHHKVKVDESLAVITEPFAEAAVTLEPGTKPKKRGVGRPRKVVTPPGKEEFNLFDKSDIRSHDGFRIDTVKEAIEGLPLEEIEKQTEKIKKDKSRSKNKLTEIIGSNWLDDAPSPADFSDNKEHF